MNDDIDVAATLKDLQAQVTALKGLIVGALCALANRDADLVREIVNSVPRPQPANVTPINPFLEAAAVELDKMLHELRDALAAE